MVTIHFSPFTCCFRKFFGVHSRVFSAMRTPKFTQSSLCSLFTVFVHNERFTNYTNHIHRFTPVTRTVASKIAKVKINSSELVYVKAQRRSATVQGSFYWLPAVESSIAVEEAVDYRDLYHVFAPRLF